MNEWVQFLLLLFSSSNFLKKKKKNQLANKSQPDLLHALAIMATSTQPFNEGLGLIFYVEFGLTFNFHPINKCIGPQLFLFIILFPLKIRVTRYNAFTGFFLLSFRKALI